MKNSLPAISRAVALFAWVAVPCLAGAQAQATNSPSADITKIQQDSAEVSRKQLERDGENQRTLEDTQRRLDTERKLKVRDAPKEDPPALDPPHQLLARLFQLPDTLKLSAPNRALAEATLQPLRERAAAAWPAWQEQATARVITASGRKAADIEQVNLQLSMRVLNEAALWFADAEPDASDTLWIDALRRGGLCDGLTAAEPAAQTAALIEALPPERRAAAWAGEAARLARWGQEERTLLPPAERAVEDTVVPALTPPALAKTLASMPAALRSALQAPGWTLATQVPAQRCELMRWWGQEQVRLKQLTPRQAMLAWRTALAPRSADFLLPGQARNGAEALDKSGFPLVARRLGLAGRVFVEQAVDASGKVLHAFVQRRELYAASLGKQVPVALEHELDQATLDRVAATTPKAPEPAAVSDGVATRRLGIDWVMK